MEDTLNSILRNKSQVLSTVIDAIDEHMHPGTGKRRKKDIEEFLFSKEISESLKELSRFLIV